MAIDCLACGERVHETAVKCPHCGQRSGAAPTKPTTAEAAAIAQLAARKFYTELEVLAGPANATPLTVVAGVSAIRLVAGVVAAVAETGDEPEPAAPTATIPRAIARARARPPTVEPLESTAPAPAPPPSDRPRFLK